VNWKQKQAGKGHIIVRPTHRDAPQNTKVTDKDNQELRCCKPEVAFLLCWKAAKNKHCI
jgi:hypothetical protein